jgi:hypothetical protein
MSNIVKVYFRILKLKLTLENDILTLTKLTSSCPLQQSRREHFASEIIFSAFVGMVHLTPNELHFYQCIRTEVRRNIGFLFLTQRFLCDVAEFINRRLILLAYP